VILNENHLALLEQRDGRLRRFTVGHELGHWSLHADAIRSGTLKLFEGGRVWCRDGSTDPVERQAEMFSAALLMPREQMLDSVPAAPWHGWSTVYRLADQFRVNATPMIIRLETLGWTETQTASRRRDRRRPTGRTRCSEPRGSDGRLDVAASTARGSATS
jgi:Zn-dependent peptidase ImmA (M78 family)